MEISNIQSQLEVIRPKARFNPMSPRKSKINGGGESAVFLILSSHTKAIPAWQMELWSLDSTLNTILDKKVIYKVMSFKTFVWFWRLRKLYWQKCKNRRFLNTPRGFEMLWTLLINQKHDVDDGIRSILLTNKPTIQNYFSWKKSQYKR